MATGSVCIICSKYIDHSLEMTLQVGRKWVKWSGEREIVYNVYNLLLLFIVL